MQEGYLKLISYILLLSVGYSPVYAQLDMQVKVKDYKQDTLYLGYYFGDKKYLYDTTYSDNGIFHFKADTNAPAGMYILLNKKLNRYHDVLLEDDQKFTVETDSSFTPQNVRFKGSDLNKDFYDYIGLLTEMRPKAENLRTQLPDEVAQKDLDELNQRIEEHQKALIDKYPGTILAATIQTNMEMDIPEFEGSEREVNMKKYQYFKRHYFDGIDLGEEKYLRAPFFEPYISRYIEKVVPQHPDSINLALDKVLDPMYSDSSDAFKFFLIKYLNHFAKSNIVGMDAVYVHLVNEYYKSGKAWWVEEKQLEKILDEVDKIEPTLIGKTAPDIKIKKLDDNEEFTLHSLASPYTVLFFWDPDCGHCKKAMPHIIDFYKVYRDKGVEMVAICTKLNNDAQSKCLEYIKEREDMDIFLNAYDPFLRSRYKQKYDVRSTPRIFILDENKKILMKSIPGEKLSEVMQQIMDVQSSKSG